MVTEASNKFSRILYKELRKKNSKNLIVSPFSLSAALAMITPGAKGLTLSQVDFVFFVVIICKHSLRQYFQIKESLYLPSLKDTLLGYRYPKIVKNLVETFALRCLLPQMQSNSKFTLDTANKIFVKKGLKAKMR